MKNAKHFTLLLFFLFTPCDTIGEQEENHTILGLN